MTDVKEHPILFKAEMIRAILAGQKWMTRRVVTMHNSLIDGTGQGIRAHWPHLEWDKAWVDPGPSPAGNPGPYWKVPCNCLGDAKDLEVVHRVHPRVFAGDSIYAKETWRAVMESCRTYVEFRAGPPDLEVIDRDMVAGLRKISLRFAGARKDRHSDAWKFPLHMPRWAARIVRPVVGVRAERVRDISGADARAEGVDWKTCPTIPEETKGGVIHERIMYRAGFRHLWNSINGKKPGRAWEDNPPVWVYEWEKHEGASE